MATMIDRVWSVAEFERWTAKAKPGDAVAYHHGVYASGKVCRYAADMSDAGLVALVRRRVESGFQFEAQRTKKRAT